ncbi:hypothetical protein O3G_MSEX010752 [Manduca sexta]|uniref:C2H2-type domain-containing protein n=1 Tax=Manduca sexta TaxID=7130 RepID=A0A921ZK95_MANSE|nr:hypothetical protein O3G_MSEX010752 [Manduca sexta]KAG6458253.1 hypothetical protein O3G_MSEX010752 [Manduca sexta]
MGRRSKASIRARAYYLRETEQQRQERLRKNRVRIALKRAIAKAQRLMNSNQSMSTENITMELNEYTDVPIKEEVDDGQLYIKTEIETHEDEQNVTDNPFENVQLHVKEESNIEKDPETDLFTVETEEIKPDVEKSSSPMNNLDGVDIKQEDSEIITGDEVISYDYPNFEDSMDSNEAVALSKVEACLQDDGLKSEMHENIDDGNYYKVIKNEADLTVTETHLISNKLINTTSTITNPRDGLIESKTTKTLVMEIRPMTEATIPLKLGNPEEILPTNNNADYDAFQLNSITGDVLSLEQQAYGLLEKKSNKYQKDKKYTCPKCSNAYTCNSQLQKHLRVHDSIEKRALGIIKGVKTRTENRNKRLKLKDEEEVKDKQQIVKKEGYECTCGNVFRRRSRMETCLRSHNLFDDTNSYPCVTCSRQFKSKEELAQHRKRVHRKRFPCKFCPTDYNTRKELFKHLQIHQKVQLMEYKVISEVVKSKQKLNCFMCSKSYNELSDLKSHVMEDHKEPYSCPHCKRTFPKIIDFGNHTKTYHPDVECQSVLDVLEAFSKLVKAWKCEECGMQFHEADKLALHQIEKHSPELKADPQLQCEDCRRVFFTQKGLTSHRRIHHSTENVEEAQPEETGVMCLECRKMCKDMNALTSHMRLHSPDRKYPCKFCDFRFATPEKRKAHAEIHTGVMKYVCFICEYQCSSENRLKQHKFSTKHKNMKEFLLSGVKVPEESSSKESEPKKEEKAVKKRKRERDRSDSESSEDSQVPCDICGDVFPSESEMLEHKQTHPFIEFPNEDKPSRIFFK